MSSYSRSTMLAAFLTIAVMLALAVARTPVARSQEAEESLLEQELARAAEAGELAVTAPSGPLPQLPASVHLPLLAGMDDVAVPAYTIEPSSTISKTAFSGIQVWGAAYDAVGDIVYISAGAQLYGWPVGGTLSLIAGFEDEGGNAIAIVALAFYDGQLYGTRNIANEAVYAIDHTTGVATVAIDYVEADFDYGGLAFDPTNGDLYGLNDDTTPHGSGLFLIESDGSGRFVAPYPAGQTDLDGLAIGPDRRAYLIPDEPGVIYVYDLAAGAYLPSIPNPWTTAETFSAGTYLDIDSRTICSAPGLAIPDNNPAGVSDSITVDESFKISDLDLVLDVSHTWVGDLRVTLRHEDSGAEVEVVERPGVPATTFGCSGDNIDAVIDDEGGDGSVENSCVNGTPGLSGNVTGGDPPDDTLLATFEGENLAGTWTLTISDNSGVYTGALEAWCVAAEGGQPALSVNPATLTGLVAPETSVTRTLSLDNSGAVPLSWEVYEESVPPSEPGTGAPLVEGMLTYDNRDIFDSAFPELPVETFEAGLWANGTSLACPAPFDSATDNGCFSPGGILPGISFQDNPLNDSGGGPADGLLGYGANVFGATSKAVVATTFVDAFEVVFDPAVHVAGMDLMHVYSGDAPVSLSIYDEADALMATTAAVAGNAGNFWGVYSETAIGRIEILSPLTAADGAEGVDNVAFGAANFCDGLDDVPWLSLSSSGGEVSAGSSDSLTVTFDAEGLSPGPYQATLCFETDDPGNPLLRVPLTLTVAEPEITLTKTVGLDPAMCATESSLDLGDDVTSAEVTYCYRVENSGVFTLTSHTLVDDEIGTILSNFPYMLVPGASAFLTQTVTVYGPTVNEATWTAVMGPEEDSASAEATASATVNMGSALYLPYFVRATPPAAPGSVGAAVRP